MKVLVVDDSPGPAGALATELRRLGYAVELRAGYRRAAGQDADSGFDAVVLDLETCGDAGLLTLHELRESDRDALILVLTAREQIHDRVTALIQGASDFLVKPVSAQQLHARIRELSQTCNACLTRADAGDSGSAAGRPATSPGTGEKELYEPQPVFSQSKLRDILERVISAVACNAESGRVELRRPAGRLATVLVDARWMELLLVKLLDSAISLCPPGAAITIEMRSQSEHCALEIGNPVAESPLDTAPDVEARLALAASIAERLGLGFHAGMPAAGRWRATVSRIKTV